MKLKRSWLVAGAVGVIATSGVMIANANELSDQHIGDKLVVGENAEGGNTGRDDGSGLDSPTSTHPSVTDPTATNTGSSVTEVSAAMHSAASAASPAATKPAPSQADSNQSGGSKSQALDPANDQGSTTIKKVSAPSPLSPNTPDSPNSPDTPHSPSSADSGV